MRINIIILLFSLLFSTIAFAQVISGKVVDNQTNKGIAFVNVGILHKNNGTVSDETGGFKLNLSEIPITDTIKFSCIGYQDYTISVSLFKQGNGTYTLNPKTAQLKPVVIKPVYTQLLKLGEHTENKNVTGGFTSNNLGSELGTVFNYGKKKPGRLKDISFSITSSGYDTLLFRLNVYKMSKGIPAENILTEPIYIKTTNKQGVLTCDLSKYNITITGPVLVSLEWVRDLYGDKLFFSFRLFKKVSFARKTSQADWVKIQASAGIWGTVETEK